MYKQTVEMVANASIAVERIKVEIAGATKAISSKLSEINALGTFSAFHHFIVISNHFFSFPKCYSVFCYRLTF